MVNIRAIVNKTHIQNIDICQEPNNKSKQSKIKQTAVGPSMRVAKKLSDFVSFFSISICDVIRKPNGNCNKKIRNANTDII